MPPGENRGAEGVRPKPRVIQDDSEAAYFDRDDSEDESESSEKPEVEVLERRRANAARFLEARQVPLEEDPLDKFMADLAASNEGQETVSKSGERSFFSSNERIEPEEDDVEKLQEFLEKARRRDEEEVTETIQKLQPVDHSSISYPELNKNVYKESESLSCMTLESHLNYRQSHKIEVSGFQVPWAIRNFENHLSIERRLLANIRSQGWNTPTPIQAQLIPSVLSGRDVFALAPTGSGKTAAYLIPALQHARKHLDQRRLAQLPSRHGPVVLLLAPTREISFQVFGVCQKLAEGLMLRISCFTGGYNKTEQFKEILRGFEICIGTPGRIVDLATMKDGLQFCDTTMMVIDEADRMFQEGFADAVLSLSDCIRPDKQAVLITATAMHPDIENVRKNVLGKNALKIVVGGSQHGQANILIDQRPIVFADERKKAEWLVGNVGKMIRWDRQVLIFCNAHGRVVDLTALINDALTEEEKLDVKEQELLVDKFFKQDSSPNPPDSAEIAIKSGIDALDNEGASKVFARSFFGDMQQGERAQVLRNFSKKRFPILVATDVASRGLDIPKIAVVVSYDPPSNEEVHLHRIGRTGRAGVSGIAYTLIARTDKNGPRISALVAASMAAAQQEVPRPVVQLALKYEPYRRASLSGAAYVPSRGKRSVQQSSSAASSSGLGFDNQLSSKRRLTSEAATGSFVSAAKSTSDVTRKSHRWDSRQINNGKTLEPFSQKEGPRVFGPNDEISSDSDDNEVSGWKQASSSLLDLKKRQLRASQNKAKLLLQQQMNAASIAANQAIK